MMNLTTVKTIFREKENYFDKEVQIGGWVRNNRGSKNFGFLVVHDGTFFEPILFNLILVAIIVLQEMIIYLFYFKN